MTAEPGPQRRRGGGGGLKELPVHWEAARRDVALLLDAVEKSSEHRVFLARARPAKAAGRGMDLDRQVLAGARAVLDRGQQAAAASGRLLSELSATGALARAVDEVERSLGGGKVIAADLRGRLAASEARAVLTLYGVGPATLDAFLAQADKAEVELSIVEGDLQVAGFVGGRAVLGRVGACRTEIGMPRSPAALLAAANFEAQCEALRGGRPAYLQAAPPRAPGRLTIEELLMASVLQSQREAVRHVRKLEDTGLSTHAGGEPATVVLIIAGALFVAGLIISAIECEQFNDGLNDDDLGCRIGHILMSLGIIAFVISLGVDDKNASGGPMLSGPLRQLEGQPA